MVLSSTKASFDLVSGVDECFICIKRLENLIDGTYVSYLVRLSVCVCVCVLCVKLAVSECVTIPAYGVMVVF